MDKRGFVFVETIVAIVVLASSLLLLYSSFHKILQSEKSRIYYDDIVYISRTWYIKDRLSNLSDNDSSDEDNLKNIIVNDIMKSGKPFAVVNLENILNSENFLNRNKERNFFSHMFNSFEVSEGSKMILIDVKDLGTLGTLKSCKKDSEDTLCQELYESLNRDDDFLNYIKTIYVDITCDYILVVKYHTCNSEDTTNCKDFYSWVSVL